MLSWITSVSALGKEKVQARTLIVVGYVLENLDSSINRAYQIQDLFYWERTASERSTFCSLCLAFTDRCISQQLHMPSIARSIVMYERLPF